MAPKQDTVDRDAVVTAVLTRTISVAVVLLTVVNGLFISKTAVGSPMLVVAGRTSSVKIPTTIAAGTTHVAATINVVG